MDSSQIFNIRILIVSFAISRFVLVKISNYFWDTIYQIFNCLVTSTFFRRTEWSLLLLLLREHCLGKRSLNISVFLWINRNSHLEVFLGKGVLKICSTFTWEYPCQSAISIKLLCNFIEIAFRHGCFPVNLLHILRTPFRKNTSGSLLLNTYSSFFFFSIYFCLW